MADQFGGLSGKDFKRYVEEMYGTSDVNVEQLAYALTMLSPVNYALAYHTAKGHPITFDISGYDYNKAVGHRPWQKGILEVSADVTKKDVNIIKARQLGLSEVGVEGLMYFADTRSFDAPKILYTFPTYRAVQDFLKSRIRTQLDTGYYSTLVDKNNYSMNQMSVRDSTIFFRSASKASSLEGIDISMFAMDEYERYAGTSAESSGMESLKGDNRYGLIRRWSTPGAPEFGIDLKYKESDQRKWMIRCQHCGYYQEMDFEKNIEIVDESMIDRMSKTVHKGATRYICAKCGQSLEESRWYNGEWVTSIQDDQLPAGFMISQMDAVWLTSDQIYSDYLNATSIQIFYNYTLGRAYQNESVKLQEHDITDNMRDYLPEDMGTRGDFSFISAGIDWGEHYHHIVIMGMKSNGDWAIIHLERVATSSGQEHIEEDLHQVIKILERYSPDIICPDFGYNGNYNDRLAQHFNPDPETHVVYSVKSRTARSNGDYIAHFSETDGVVSIDKLMQVMMTISNIKSGRIGFYKDYDANLHLFLNHWQHVLIRDEEDEKTGETYKSITRTGDDHYGLSSTYAAVGMGHIVEALKIGSGDTPMMSTIDNGKPEFETAGDSFKKLSKSNLNNLLS